jgi:hypothetical protein
VLGTLAAVASRCLPPAPVPRPVEQRLFSALPDDAWVYPGHSEDTTIGAERPHLGEWRARGCGGQPAGRWPSWVSTVRLSQVTHHSAIRPSATRRTPAKSNVARFPDGGNGPSCPVCVPA